MWFDFLATTRIDDFLRQALNQPELAETAAIFISECGRIAFFQDFLEQALDTSLGIEERREALRVASQVVASRIGEAPVFPSEAVVRLLQERDPEIQTYVVWTLNAFGYDQANQILKDIVVDQSRGRPLREETVKLLQAASRGEFFADWLFGGKTARARAVRAWRGWRKESRARLPAAAGLIAEREAAEAKKRQEEAAAKKEKAADDGKKKTRRKKGQRKF